MNRVDSTQGYTIVETLIVLAVSSLMLVSASLLISGQQNKAEFKQGIRDFESQIQDIANDVSTGYYATNNNFECETTGSSHAKIKLGSKEAGTNIDCIFIGRVLHFAPQGAGKDTFDIYSVAGNKLTSGGIGVSNLTEAMPTALGTGSTSPYDTNLDLKETHKMPGGIEVAWVKYTPPAGGSVPTLIGGFGIFTTFVGSGLQNGTISVDVIPVAPNTASLTPILFVDKINGLNSLSDANPDQGIEICLQSAGTDEYVKLIVGDRGRSFGTKTEFYSGTCP